VGAGEGTGVRVEGGVRVDVAIANGIIVADGEANGWRVMLQLSINTMIITVKDK
jgi:hypothetical protein